AFNDRATLALQCFVGPAPCEVLGGNWLWVTPHLQAVAANSDGLAGDVGCIVGRQKSDQTGNIGSSTKAEVLAEEIWHGLAGFIGFNSSREEWHSFGHSGSRYRNNRIDGDTCALHFHSPGPDHTHDAGFGCSVVGLAKVAALPGWRTDGNDSTFNLIVFEVIECGTNAGKGTTEVHVDHLVEIVI